MRIGVRAHDLGKQSVEELAQKISEMGFDCIQLALSKAISGMDFSLGKLNPGMAWRIGKTFERYGIQIAVLGCYINPVHPDKEERRRQIERFKEHLRFARGFGCGIVATETGSINADFSFHPDNHGEKAFGELADSVKEMTDEAERFGVIAAIEGVTRYVTHTPERIAKLLEVVDSNNLQVVFDPVNLISIDNYHDQEGVITRSFELFGDRIVILHAKDFVVSEGRMITVQAGKGMLNYDLLFKLLKANKPDINILMENAKPETMVEGIAYLRTKYFNAL
ncbi:sugar phosphate isomerase/epimerase family protein [Acetivibrio mesophilus]|uniref:Sugar phosphate isomerase/epimerase n=1 Tax=Acetivibrio mesophilus TaxID=2487273 RepID=A0A4Q0I2J2_9FIRM|nr:sugar phosphate isomerase/epimerase family protein [Acetivibrio mesophilus]ODM25340.1 AP endonuclease [Clostridium sp. Bc-iso-3]RXE58416.1 sugar phosphate isomerase/epimerase [Acetivibrio mesophilus]HHV28641.1 sugar phosphate isomerase/epimerase [Clostridium sp.]